MAKSVAPKIAGGCVGIVFAVGIVAATLVVLAVIVMRRAVEAYADSANDCPPPHAFSPPQHFKPTDAVTRCGGPVLGDVAVEKYTVSDGTLDIAADHTPQTTLWLLRRKGGTWKRVLVASAEAADEARLSHSRLELLVDHDVAIVRAAENAQTGDTYRVSLSKETSTYCGDKPMKDALASCP